VRPSVRECCCSLLVPREKGWYKEESGVSTPISYMGSRKCYSPSCISPISPHFYLVKLNSFPSKLYYFLLLLLQKKKKEEEPAEEPTASLE
jgi:hypothetical protein